MPQLTVHYKDYSLPMDFQRNSYYTSTELEPGKTIYQILFEHLIDKKTVFMRRLARKYAGVCPFINAAAIRWCLKNIEAALKKSPDKRLNEMRFIKAPHGGATDVMVRRSSRSRFTPPQKALFLGQIKKMHSRGRNPPFEKIRHDFLETLQRKNLDANVVVGFNTIKRAMRSLRLPQRQYRQRGRPRKVGHKLK